ncbi:unnamed protein product [Schistosoma curassoni]|nr:unnamed protein product [Schistosoma curassoni]
MDSYFQVYKSIWFSKHMLMRAARYYHIYQTNHQVDLVPYTIEHIVRLYFSNSVDLMIYSMHWYCY